MGVNHAQEGQDLLVVVDDPEVRKIVVEGMDVPGRRILNVNTAEKALAIIRSEPPSVIILDSDLPDTSGLELLSETTKMVPTCLVIIITASTEEEKVVDAMRRGAMDYLVKPFCVDELKQLVQRAFTRIRVNAQMPDDHDEGKAIARNGFLVGKSPKMLEVFKMIGRLARSDIPVLITGESGTGKELVARALHSYGPRANGPFMAVDCAGLPESLLESELFGYERGAFTGAVMAKPGRFELADGGTLFLDEIGNMSLVLQAKLLRVLQERTTQRLGSTGSTKFDARLVVATNLNIKELAVKGMFREDLLFRVAGTEIHLPRLRDRLEDMELLAEHILKGISSPRGRMVLDRKALELMRAYCWPGNVREMQHVLHRATALAQGHVISDEDLPVEIRQGSVALDADFVKSLGTRKFLPMQEMRRKYAYHVMVACGGNKARAAKTLNIDRKTLNSLVGCDEQEK